LEIVYYKDLKKDYLRASGRVREIGCVPNLSPISQKSLDKRFSIFKVPIDRFI